MVFLDLAVGFFRRNARRSKEPRTRTSSVRDKLRPERGETFLKFVIVDPRGIEPLTRQCECRVIPLYYGPIATKVKKLVFFKKNKNSRADTN